MEGGQNKHENKPYKIQTSTKRLGLPASSYEHLMHWAKLNAERAFLGHLPWRHAAKGNAKEIKANKFQGDRWSHSSVAEGELPQDKPPKNMLCEVRLDRMNCPRLEDGQFCRRSDLPGMMILALIESPHHQL